MRTTFLKRSLALVLALVLMVSSTNLGAALQVFAVENGGTSVSAGELVANNYELTEAEAAILSSGMLVGETYTYTVPDDSELITVDTENTTITAEKSGEWVPVKAYIVATDGTTVVETVTLTNGQGTYNPEVGNTFSVKVDYTLTQNVDAEVQETLLNTPAWLKSGVNAMKTGYDATYSSLGFVLEAMDVMNQLADGIVIPIFGTITVTLQFKADAIAAVESLNAQLSANDGKLDLQVANAAYAASASKVQYLLENGAAYKQIMADTLADLSAISNDKMLNDDTLDQYMSQAEPVKYAAWVAFKDILSNAIAGLETAVAADWTAAEKGVNLVGATVAYGELDNMVKALGETTAVAQIKNPLHVKTTQIQKNLSMFNVTVSVALNVVEDEVNSEALVSGGETQKVVLTLAEGATAAEIEAAIAESDIVNKAQQSWGDKFDADNFVSSVNAQLPEVLMADFEYVITYNPVEYAVEIVADENVVYSEEHPFGYQLKLPVHANKEQSYDYYDAENNYYPQGTVVEIEKAMTFTRLEGKAYTSGKLLETLAGNYTVVNTKPYAILMSQALTVDKSFNYRQPSTGELELLVTLDGNKLTAKTYPSSYEGLFWTADTYVVDGVSHDFNGETEVTINGEFDQVSVYYSLQLTNFDSKSIFDLVAELDEEAQGQLTVLNTLKTYGDDMSILNMTMMLGLQGMVQNAEMKAIVGQMMDPETGCFDAGGNLILNNIIAAYSDTNSGGLYYYYNNDAFVRGEIEKLSNFLKALLAKDEYKAEIETILGKMNLSQYAEALDELSGKLENVSNMLAPKNAKISTSNDGALSNLATALNMEGSAVVTDYGAPFISMPAVVRVSEKFSVVTVEVTVNGTSNTDPIFVRVSKGAKLTAAEVASLKDAVNAFVASCGINTKYYNTTYNAAELDALTKNGLDSNMTLKYEWTKATYQVNVPGAAAQNVTIDNLTITLPGHPQASSGMSYEYTIDGVTAKSGIYPLTIEQLDKLIAGKLEITRTEKNEAVEKLVNMVNNINADMGYEALTLVEKNGLYTGLNVEMGAEDMMDFVMGLVMNSGYNYIGMGGEGLKYATSDGLEISMQTLVDAILTDEGFNNDRLISLAQKGKGTIVSTTMELGNNSNDLNYTLDFNLSLKSVPSALTENLSYIKTASEYLKFQAENGVLNVDVILPDQAYAAYAIALVAAGEVEKTDINEIGQAIAVNFLYEYFEAIIGSDMDMVTFSNTMKMLGVNMDLTGYNNAYAAAVNAYNEHIDVTISDDGADVDISIPGQAAINALLKVTGAGAVPGLNDMLGMIKEYNDEGTIDASINAKLANTSKNIYALIVDAQANGTSNKFAAPTSYTALKNETKTLAGYSVVMLMNDVEGDLTFSGTTVLDLNGKNVEGAIKSTGNLYIIDSTMDTANAGKVKDGVSGNVTIIAGNYGEDVSAFLKDGYYMDGETVRNELYKIVATGDSVEFVLNANAVTDLPNVTALAIDIAADLVLNYGYFGALGIDEYNLVDMHITDLIGLYDSRDVNALATELIDCFTIGVPGYENQDGFEALVNMIIADLINFDKISEGLANNTPIVEHDITLKPYKIEIAQAQDGNHVSVNIGTNNDRAKTTTFRLTIENANDTSLAKRIEVLADIVEDRTEIMIDVDNMPEVTGGYAYASLAGKANVYVDMSGKDDYAVIVGVILANGNYAKRAAVASAINTGNMGALKAVVDNTTAAELIKALKSMKTTTGFTSMARTVGVSVNVQSAAELEALFHTVLCGMGKVLSEAAVTGSTTKLSSLYNDEGYYSLSLMNLIGQNSYNNSASVEIANYLAVLELTASEMSLNVKLFDGDETCMIGDVNHDGKIGVIDAGLVQEYIARLNPAIFCFTGADVNGDGKITVSDAGLIRDYIARNISVFPAESN